MKLLLVFASALVLVAHGNEAPSENKPEVGAGYAVIAGQEAGGEAPQVPLAEPLAVQENVRVAGAEEEPRAYDAAESATEETPPPESGIYIPSVTRICTSYACKTVCWRYGFLYGQCISISTCWCHN